MDQARMGFCRLALIAGLLFPTVVSAADQPVLYGEMIRQTKVEGYALHYHLLPRSQRALLLGTIAATDAAKDDSAVEATHFLLFYLWTSDGKNVPIDGVDFEISAPDGTVQAVKAIPVKDGYGADVAMAQAGTYLVKMKARIGTFVLADEFTYK